jgi:hypothetical protein
MIYKASAELGPVVTSVKYFASAPLTRSGVGAHGGT